MKDILIKILDECFYEVVRFTPTTKKKTVSISIQDIRPTDIIRFMEENNIPEDAYFTGTDNGYDGWDDVVLEWDVSVPTTELDKIEYRRKRFANTAFRKLYKALTANGYKRAGVPSQLLDQFKSRTVYEMYVEKDFDTLIKYYSLYFKKL